MAKVTIGDVAREAGVALGTVSNALNHPEKVRPETLKAVNDAIRRLGYAPNQSARLLAGGRNPTFGLVLPRLSHGLSLQIASGASVEANRQGYGLLIANADNDEALESRYTRYFMGTQMSGVLVQAPSSDAALPAVQPGRIPVVFLDAISDEPGFFVAADHREQGALLADHAIGLGAQRVAVLGRAESPQDRRRLNGVCSIMERYPDVALTVLDSGNVDLALDGYELGQKLAALPAAERPDFIIGLSDVLACGAIEGIEAAGLAVPEDIAVAGCDGNPLAWSGSVPLTTCAPTGYELGRRGVLFLIEQIQAAKSGEAYAELMAENHQALVKPFMLTRASTVGATPFQVSDTIGLNLGTFL